MTTMTTKTQLTFSRNGESIIVDSLGQYCADNGYTIHSESGNVNTKYGKLVRLRDGMKFIDVIERTVEVETEVPETTVETTAQNVLNWAMVHVYESETSIGVPCCEAGFTTEAQSAEILSNWLSSDPDITYEEKGIPENLINPKPGVRIFQQIIRDGATAIPYMAAVWAE